MEKTAFGKHWSFRREFSVIHLVSERKVRVLNKMKIKTTRSISSTEKRHPSSPSATPRQAKAQRQKGRMNIK
jgi:hypothetical protein